MNVLIISNRDVLSHSKYCVVEGDADFYNAAMDAATQAVGLWIYRKQFDPKTDRITVGVCVLNLDLTPVQQVWSMPLFVPAVGGAAPVASSAEEASFEPKALELVSALPVVFQESALLFCAEVVLTHAHDDRVRQLEKFLKSLSNAIANYHDALQVSCRMVRVDYNDNNIIDSGVKTRIGMLPDAFQPLIYQVGVRGTIEEKRQQLGEAVHQIDEAICNYDKLGRMQAAMSIQNRKRVLADIKEKLEELPEQYRCLVALAASDGTADQQRAQLAHFMNKLAEAIEYESQVKVPEEKGPEHEVQMRGILTVPSYVALPNHRGPYMSVYVTHEDPERLFCVDHVYVRDAPGHPALYNPYTGKRITYIDG